MTDRLYQIRAVRVTKSKNGGNRERQILNMEGRKKGNVLFYDALNTFLFTVIWRRTYGR